ncbi:MAG: hypothetical protein U1E83_11065, partial [Methylotetracoccus sp.]
MKRHTPFLLAALAGCAFASSASANYHEEGRDKDKLHFSVGWYPDPPHAGEPQQMFLTLWYDGRPIVVSDNDPKNPETHPEDKVDVKLTMQRLANPNPNAKVLEEVVAPGRYREVWKGYNYYGVWLTARKAGPIAIVLNGEVNGVKLVAERFVCKPPERLVREKFNGISCLRERTEPLGIAPVPLKPY